MANRVVIPVHGSGRISRHTLTTSAILLVAAVVLRFLIHYAFTLFSF